MALHPNGWIVAAGESIVGGTRDFALARYNPNGSPDTSFGTGGKVTTDFGANEAAIGVGIQPDGRIVATGFRINSATGPIDFALARYLGR